MYGVLILDKDYIEGYVIKNILSEHFNTIDSIIEVLNIEDAFEAIKNHTIDLLIFSMDYTLSSLSNLINYSKMKNPDIITILTTYLGEDEAAYAIARIKGNKYLLKPYTQDLLISTLKPYLHQREVAAEKEVASMVYKGLTELKKVLREGQYKKCVSSIRKFIDSIFDNRDEILISEHLSEFASGLTDIAKEYKLSTSGLICLENVISKLTFDKHTFRYNSYSLLIDMMNSLFDDFYRNHIYNDEITRALNYIDRNIKAFLTLEQVADFINMSPSYFSKQFKKTQNKTFISYITEEKIHLAKYMLTYSNIPIINISYELSFRETNYFSKVFKKVVGKTPTEYREQIKAI